MSSINKICLFFYVGTDSNIQSSEGFQCVFFLSWLLLKNCEILPCLQADKLACHSFRGASGRHGTHGQRQCT